ncbi:MAG: CCA tRNA nucleotidyltransferase [Hyphomicrobiales bacterium]|nr:CCA tRNA nucleotidyltransferase [Hyphomicrobiales bacterium]
MTVDTSEPIGQIHPQPWMLAPETQNLLDALQANGQTVRFIGGCVRDAVLKRPVKDIDLALAMPPETVMTLLRNAGIHVIPTGIDHGTVTAVVGGRHFEITSLRVDVETDGRHARVDFTDDWAADAARRDFTINAMSCTADGYIYDYYGGLEDLSVGRIRFVGDAQQRIVEDALRILRFFRFYAFYGQPPADPDALYACQHGADTVFSLSGERIRGELLRLLLADDPTVVLRMMRDTGVLSYVLPEAGSGFDRLEKLCWLESRALAVETVRPDAIRRLAALLDADTHASDAAAQRLKLSNSERLRLKMALSTTYPIDPEGAPLPLKQGLYRLGTETMRTIAILTWAGELSRCAKLPRQRTDAWMGVLGAIDAWQPVTFPLTGADVLALGVPQGREVGRVLRSVETWWEDGGFQVGREQCLDRLREIVATGR